VSSTLGSDAISRDTIPIRYSPGERRNAGLTVVELAGWPEDPVGRAVVRETLDMLGVLAPLQNDQETP
jgi:hypothetical protein